MSVQTQFYNFQQNPDGLNWDAPPYESCNPAPQSMRRYLEARWGLTYLGCHGDRPIVSGQSISSHAFGAAVDMRYENPGPGLYVCDTEIIPWLIATSKETGLQAIHHYRRSRIWRPPGTSGRPADGDGWRNQTPGTQMGQTWALWLHLEFHPAALSDGRSIEEKTGAIVAPPPPPPPPPVVVQPPVTPPNLDPTKEFTVDVTLTTVRRGSTGHDVRRCQSLLAHMFGQDIGPIDGSFGPKTEAGVKNVQRFFGMTVDGIVGPKTWTVLIELP